MTFSCKKLTNQQVRDAIASKIRDLNHIEEVNNQIIEDTKFSLAEGLEQLLTAKKISQENYNQQMAQCREELTYRFEAQTDINKQKQRLEDLCNSEDDATSFHIPSDTSETELTIIIKILKDKLNTTNAPQERSFLQTMSQTLVTCKHTLEAGRVFSDLEIVIAKEEEEYNNQLLNDFRIANYQNQINELDTIIKNSGKYSAQEKGIINTLCSSIINEVSAIHDLLVQSRSNPKQSAELEPQIERHKAKINKCIDDAEKNPVSDGIRGVINYIYKILGLEPRFRAQIPKEFTQIKNDLQQLKSEAHGQDNPEQSSKKLGG